MEIGVYVSCSQATERPDVLGRLIEQAGFDAMTLGEHVHAATADNADADGVPDYANLLEIFAVMAAALQATSRLQVSSGIMQLPQRDPITTAKSAATLDFLFGGRLSLVMASGSQTAEIRNHGVDPDARREVLHERMLAMREIFANEVASFRGEHVAFDGVMVGPRRNGRIDVPVLLGGNSDGVEERVLEFADGWGPWQFDGSLAEQVARFTTANPGIPVHVFGVDASPAAIAEYGEAGADRVYLYLGDAKPGEAEAKLADLRRAADGAQG